MCPFHDPRKYFWLHREGLQCQCPKMSGLAEIATFYSDFTPSHFGVLFVNFKLIKTFKYSKSNDKWQKKWLKCGFLKIITFLYFPKVEEVLKPMMEALKEMDVVKIAEVFGIAWSLLPSDESALSAPGFTHRPCNSVWSDLNLKTRSNSKSKESPTMIN